VFIGIAVEWGIPSRLSGCLTTFVARMVPSVCPPATNRPRSRFELLSPWARDALQFTSAVERAARLIVAARRGIGAAYGLKVSGWRMLHLVSRRGTHITIAEAARRLNLTRQSAHEVVHELGAAKLIQTERSSVDRRALRLVLTPQGARKLENLEATMKLLLLEMTNDISLASLVATTVLLNRVTNRLRKCQSVVARSRRVMAPSNAAE
jgi:DNA-binding MarR family transcriptional regulator